MSAYRRAWIAVAVVVVGVLSIAATALAQSAKTLRPGAAGPSVVALQIELAKTGLDVSADGIYGTSTTQAVQAFQHAANLKATGIATRATRHKLLLVTTRTAASAEAPNTGGASLDAPAAPHALGDRIPLQSGMSGDDVRDLKSLLVKSGVKVRVDGRFGAGTVRAERSFEHKTGLTMDGVVDAGDIAALRGDVDPESGDTDLPLPLAPGDKATINSDGLAQAPASAPPEVQAIIAAGNAIAHKPYRFGGGHGAFRDSAYDCSGSVSYALHGGGLLDTPMDSTELESFGSSGAGQWVTIYANSGHTFMVVAGLRFDTSGASAHDGDRWQNAMRSGSGYVVRHPSNL